jgi:hypothetical protein
MDKKKKRERQQQQQTYREREELRELRKQTGLTDIPKVNCYFALR